MDGLVGGDVDIGGARGESPIGARRQVAEATGLAAGGDARIGHRLRLLPGGLAPVSGEDVVDGLPRRGEVQRQQGLDGGGAARGEHHRVVVRDRQQGAQVGFGPARDLEELRAAVAEFDDRGAGIAEFQHLRLRLPQHGLG